MVYFVIVILLLLGALEAIEGFRRLYGFAASHHGLYTLTGSFYNPGPYMGFLVVLLPVVVSLPKIHSRAIEEMREEVMRLPHSIEENQFGK